MQKLSENIAEILASGNVILPIEKEQCSYGLEIMLSSICEILCIIVMSAFLGNLLQTLVFFLAFIPLRIYAGGYHADTRIRCFAILIGVYLVFTYFIKAANKDIYPYVILVGTIFTLIMVTIFAPLLHSRKHISQNEIKTFRGIAVKISMAETLITLICTLFLNKNIYLLSFACGQLAVSVSMVAALIKKILKERSERYEKNS